MCRRTILPSITELTRLASDAPADEAWRLFIAVELPAPVRTAVAGLAEGLPPDLRQIVRWVAPDNIHITLKFLGDGRPQQAVYVAQSLTAAARDIQPLTLRLNAPGVFPSARAPRILWAGLAGDVAVLGRLHAAIEQSLLQMGCGPDREQFTAHATAGRVSRDARGPEIAALGQAWSKLRLPEEAQAEFIVKGVALFRSHLHTGGSRYERLYVAELRP